MLHFEPVQGSGSSGLTGGIALGCKVSRKEECNESLECASLVNFSLAPPLTAEPVQISKEFQNPKPYTLTPKP